MCLTTDRQLADIELTCHNIWEKGKGKTQINITTKNAVLINRLDRFIKLAVNDRPLPSSATISLLKACANLN